MNKDINDDPIFNELKQFAKQSAGPEFMPAEFYEAFRNAKRSKLRSKSFMGTVIGLLVASIALPSLSYAHVLPNPIASVVERVSHVIAAPVRALVGTSAPAPTVNVVATPIPSETATASIAAVTSTPTPSAVVAPTPRQVVVPTPSAAPKADPAPHNAMPSPSPAISNPGKGESHSENEGSANQGKPESNKGNSGESEGKVENSNSNKPAGAPTAASKPAVGGSSEGEHKSSEKPEKSGSKK